MHYKGKI